jgi:hypothetical protein
MRAHATDFVNARMLLGRREREELVTRCLWWLFRQPMAGRPQAYFPHDLDNAWLCALTDARADAQRRNFDAWS